MSSIHLLLQFVVMKFMMCLHVHKARLDRLEVWPIPESATASSQPPSAPQQPTASARSPRRPQAAPGAVPITCSSTTVSVTPYLPPSHLHDTLPDPATPYLLVLSLFLWQFEDWTSNKHSIFLHLLRFAFSHIQPPGVYSTATTSQNTGSTPEASSCAAAAADNMVASEQPDADGSQHSSAQSSTGARQSHAFVSAWREQQSDDEIWKAVAPMLRLFGLVNYLQKQLKPQAESDWLTATSSRYTF